MPNIQYDSLNYESAVFPREYGMGGAIFPIENGGAKFTGGVPISLGNLAWGCHIPWGAKYPVTPEVKFPSTFVHYNYSQFSNHN